MKSIKISDETHKTLLKIKLKYDIKSIDDVIQTLINDWRWSA